MRTCTVPAVGKFLAEPSFPNRTSSLFELEIVMPCLDQNYLQLHRKTSAKKCCFPVWKKSLKHEIESLLPLKKIR